MLNIVKSQIQFIGMRVGSAELASVVGKDCLYRDVLRLIERQHVIMQHERGVFGLLGRVQIPEGERAEGVQDHLQVDLAHAFEGADKKRILTQQFARLRALDVAFGEDRVVLFDLLDLLGREDEFVLDGLRFQAQQAFVAAA
jgi:hypothetical protein